METTIRPSSAAVNTFSKHQNAGMSMSTPRSLLQPSVLVSPGAGYCSSNTDDGGAVDVSDNLAYLEQQRLGLVEELNHAERRRMRELVMDEPSVELLQWVEGTVRTRSGEGEEALFARWFDAQGNVSETHTFASIWSEAGRIAHELRVSWGLVKGDRAILCFGFGLDFFAAFLGCLRAGVLAVPTYPPSPLTLSKSLAKLQSVVDACDPKVVLISADVNRLRLASKLNLLSSARRLWPDLPYKVARSSGIPGGVGGEQRDGGGGGGGFSRWFERAAGGGGVQGGAESFDEESLREDDVAFLQFTSGSTSDPKGVMVTFKNLAHNVRFISTNTEKSFKSRGFRGGDGGEEGRVRGFSWLPQYHDLGLVMCTLTPFASGWRMGYISPLDFVRRPLLWLELLSSERAMFGCAPDFSLRLCVRKWNEATPEARASWASSINLSALRWIQNGAEPVRASSVRDFAATFEALGLSSAYCGTAYGLAEHVVGVCKHEANKAGLPLSELSDQDLECVGEVDQLSEGSQLKIVDPETRREVSRGEEGEIWISSPSVAAGYWGLPELTEETFSASLAVGGGEGEAGERGGSDADTGPTFLRTGDLARLDSDGRIFISGRMKDLIIVRGRNLYPQDVEFAAQESSSIVRPGCVAAFSTHELGGELEVVLEVRKSAEDDQGMLYEGLEAVRRAIVTEGCYPSRLVAIKEKTIPKTTSGKIQRRRSRELLHQGALAVVTELTAPVGALKPAAAAAAPSASTAPPARSASESESESSSSLSSSLSSWVSASVSIPAEDGAAGAPPPPQDAGKAVDESQQEQPQQEQQEEERSQQDAQVVESGGGGGKGRETASGEGAASSDGGSGNLLSRQKSERLAALTSLVVGTAGDVLGGVAISPDQPLFDAGFDSLTAEEFVGRLQERLVAGGWVAGGAREAEAVVSSTTVFDCPTARHIAEHVEGSLGEAGAADMTGPRTDGTTPTPTEPAGDGGAHSLAVVGISCRFPGGCDSPEAFWDFLRKGADASSGVPSDRWTTTTDEAKSAQARGGFLSEGEAWAFDDSFFGVPPAEARCMDPQQRMMLEVGYEALHRAGFTRDSLRGSDTGVFVGACGTDWANLLAEGAEGGPPRGPYTSTGAASSMLANRLSFTLGTVGPSMTVDTACSSSLVALNQACLHLRSPEGGGAKNGHGSRVALVGGVNLLLSPGPFDLFTKTGMLAPDGRSKAFSADADGYGRGEGCGAVVLKRLEDATNDGDRVLAVIKGSAVAHNGRSATLTAPNGTSQRATIAAALREAGVAPAEVSYVEAHGTGTALGDPVEFGALKAVYGAERAADNPLVIGAVKSNIGHLEGAAGMSGLIKTILVLAHGAAPPNLHASDVNPRVDLASLPAVLPGVGEPTRLPRRRPRRRTASAGEDEERQGEQQKQQQGQERGQDGTRPPQPLLGGVSSFGFGGTNAHVVLEGRGGAFGGGGGVVAQRKEAGAAEVAAAAEPVPGMAFLFTGQGSQYPGMGRELYESYEDFKAVVDACDEELAGVLPVRLLSVLYGDEKDAAKLLATTRYAQPALFAVECATAAALRAAGVVPSAVMGHSLGELAAACTAGVMSLREGVRLVAERGRLMETEDAEDAATLTAGGGDVDGPECMAAVRSTEVETAAAVARLGAGRVSVAAVNGPDSVVLSGPRRLVELVAAAALSSPPPSPTRSSTATAGPTLPALASTAAATAAAAASSQTNGQEGRDQVGENDLSALGPAAANGKAAAGSSPAQGVNSSGFSTRHMSWLAGAKDPVNGSKSAGAAVVNGSESTGSVSPSSDSEEGRNNRSDSSVSTNGALSDGALSDGPLSDDGRLCAAGVVEGFNGVVPSDVRPVPAAGAAVVPNGHPAPTSGYLEPNGHHSGINSHSGTTTTASGSPLSCFGPGLPADRFRILQGVSRAFHSPSMARAASGTEAAARKVSLRDPAIPLASNVTGGLAEEGELTNPGYWGRHVLGTVRFHDGLAALASKEGISTFVEVGPSALLCGMGRRALRSAPPSAGSAAAVGGGIAAAGSPGSSSSSSVRWIAAMSPEERVAGKSGLGHVVGAVRGVNYCRKSYPWNCSTVRPAGKKAAPIASGHGGDGVSHDVPRGGGGGDGQRRPPLRVLETKWVPVGELSKSTMGDGVPVGGDGDGSSNERSESAATAVTQSGDDDAGAREPSQQPKEGEGEGEEESVWLLAGRTDASYAAVSDALSGGTVAGSSSAAPREECLAHLLTLGPAAAGGEAAAIGRLMRLLRGGAGPELNHVVYVVGGGAAGSGCDAEAGGGGKEEADSRDSGAELASFLAFAEALAAAGTDSPRPLPEAVVVTRGIHACVESDMVEGWPMSWLPGTLRSLGLQYPHLKMRHVDLPGAAGANPDAEVEAEAMRDLLKLVRGASGGLGINLDVDVDHGRQRSWAEPEVCLRAGKLFVPRLEAGRTVAVLPAGERCLMADQVSSAGTYVVTGGTGGIGLDLALRFAKAGAGGLVLLSRRGKGSLEGLEGADAHSPRGRAWRALSAIPATKVVVLRCDVTVRDDVVNALAAAASSEAGLPPVKGIVHAACPPQGGQGGGGDRDGPSPGGETKGLEQRFLAAKVAGALNLSESAVRMGMELDFLVLFSSASAVLGLVGEPGYAAANGCLDGLAWHLQRSRGCKVLSVQYGPWLQAGTAVDRKGAVEALRTLGHLGVTNDEGFSALGALIGDVSSASPGAARPPVAAVMPMHWERYASILPSGVPPLLASLVSAGASGGVAGGSGVAPVLTRAETVEVLLEAARQVTGWDGELGESDSLKEQVGMDSLQAVEFRRIICVQLGRQSVPTTLAYDCPTAGKMADELLRTATRTAAAASSTAPSSSALSKQQHPDRRVLDLAAPPLRSAPKAPAAAAAEAATAGSIAAAHGRAGASKAGRGDVAVDEVGEGEWEEERHLDNAAYLLYRMVRAFAAYLYMACVVMLPAWVFFWAVRQAAPLGGSCLLIFATLPLGWLVFGVCLCLLVAASKWVLVGRVRPGESFNTHSVRHLLWWMIQRLQSFSGLIFVDEIRRGRLVVWYYRLLGAKLGRDVFLNTVRISDPDLVTVGDGSTINEHADLSGHKIIGNRVVFGSGVTIGKGTVLLPSAYMAPEAQVADGRVVGALATAAHPTRRNSTPLAPPTPFLGVVLQVLADLVSLYFVAITVGVAAFAGFRSFSFMLEAANVFPGERMSALGYGPLSDSNMAFACYTAVFLLSRLYLPVLLVFAGADVGLSYSFLTETVLGDVGLPRVLAVAAVSAVVFHVTHMVLSVILKWALVQRFVQVDGVCCTTSWFGFRKQITDRLIMSAMMRSVLMFNGNLGNSLWLMALGGPLGRCVSVMLNKNIYTEPELLTLGDDMHVGFASSTYCSVYTAPNAFTLRKTFIGDRGLNGAGSVTLPGATLPHGAALGPNTRLGPGDRVREGALHLGSPAPVVAGRYKSPPRELSRLERALYLLAPLPLAAMSTAITLSAAFWPLLALARAAEAVGGPGLACLFAPLAWLGLGLSLAVTGTVFKWAIIGKQHPSDTKLWSLYHYRTLLVLYLQIHAHFLFVDILRRGKMFNCYARLLGASVGRDADVATMYFTDHDLVSIGDRAVVQEDCIPHPQFYFEGTMSFKPVSVGAGSNAGARSILLGGGTIKPGGSLETLGLAAKASHVRGGEGRAAVPRGDSKDGKGANVK